MIAYVQSNIGLTGSTTLTGVASGNLIVVGICAAGVDPGVGDVTDGVNTYTRISHMGPVVSGGNYQALYYAKNVTGGNLTIVNSGGDTVMVAEYSGADTSSPLDQVSASNTADSTTPTSASITPSGDGYLVVAVAFHNQDSATWAANSPALLRRSNTDNNTYERGALADYVQTTAAAIALSFTCSSGQFWGVLSASFKVSAGSPSASLSPSASSSASRSPSASSSASRSPSSSSSASPLGNSASASLSPSASPSASAPPVTPVSHGRLKDTPNSGTHFFLR